MNLFNALNGREAKAIILAEVAKALDEDTEFREHLTFPRVSWKWRLEMEIYPRTPKDKTVEAAGEAVQMQTVGEGALLSMARDPVTGALMPVVGESATHVKEILQSVPREVVAPDAVREAEGMATQTAPAGGIRTARSVEVGKAARNPVLSPGLNR